MTESNRVQHYRLLLLRTYEYKVARLGIIMFRLRRFWIFMIKVSLVALMKWAKLYTPSTLNIDLILWHTQLIMCAAK